MCVWGGGGGGGGFSCRNYWDREVARDFNLFVFLQPCVFLTSPSGTVCYNSQKLNF